ncbi:MAG: ATP-binding protein [Spirochaetales bacterium]
MIPRTLGTKLIHWANQYPVVTITGPRQSGKSTLVKALFKDKPYVSLEDLSIRQQALEDPRGFLSRFPEGAVLDEIQRVPPLTSYIQTITDTQDRTGFFILTGSGQFELMESISQTLAGRTALGRLLPFSYEEIYGQSASPPSLDQMLYTGFYPRIHDKGLQPTEAYSFYFSTYIEKDIRQVLNIRDIHKFETFIRLLAGRSGQVLNISSLAGECGISNGTLQSWITVLEQSFIVYRLKPYYKNLGKRLLKSPKLYFLDTGLLCYLLNIFDPSQLVIHPLKGQVFETYVVAEFLKNRFHRGLPDNLYYYRDQRGREVDIIAEEGPTTFLYEIKTSATFHPEYLSTLQTVASFFSTDTKKALILGSPDPPYQFKDVEVWGYPYAGGKVLD